MKWFQHYTNSHFDIKHKALIRQYGMEGYGLYWVINELIGGQGHNLTLKSHEDWMGALEDITRIEKPKILEMLQFIAEKRLISRKNLERGNLANPNLANYSDTYSKRRVRTNFEVDEVNVPLDKNTQEENRTDNSFENFWVIFPKKVAKQKATLAWKKIPASEHDAIYADVSSRRISEDWTKQGGQFIPYPASYLNAERWKDQIDISKPAPPKKICRVCKTSEGSDWVQQGGDVCGKCWEESQRSPGKRTLEQMTAGVVKQIPK